MRVHLRGPLAAARRPRLRYLFPYLPQQPSYNKRLRGCAGLVLRVIRAVAADTTLWTDDV